MSVIGNSTPDAVIVGAGFAGLYMLHRLRQLGFSARVFEAASGVGGTWYWNRYPGARCDVESLEYSYSFSPELEQEWQWTERYASQPEILRYLNHVADRFDLRRDIQFETRVTAATWTKRRTAGRSKRTAASACPRSFASWRPAAFRRRRCPTLKACETFQGNYYQTSQWPHEGVDFSGQRVAVIGTGSSAIQSIPVIAQQASHLFVFQRTPNFSVPAHNGPLPPEVLEDWKENSTKYRDRARASGFGFLIDLNETPALEASPEERRRRMKRAGVAAALAWWQLLPTSSSTRRPTTRPRSSCVPRFAKLSATPP